MMSDNVNLATVYGGTPKDLTTAGEKDAVVLNEANQPPTFSSSVIKEMHGGKLQAEPVFNQMKDLSDEETKDNSNNPFKA